MVDRDVVERRLRQLDERVVLLRDLADRHDEGSYRREVALRAQVERHLQLAIQAAIDLASHVVAEDTSALPDDYGQTFLALADAGIILPDLADRLRRAAGLRNLLVHGYSDINDRIVWASLNDLGDLTAFATAMARYLSD